MPFKFVKSYKNTYDIASRALFRNKVRAALTILGITIGITAVIVVLSAGRAIEDFIVGQVTTFGTDYIAIEIKVPNTGYTSTENAGNQAQGVTITTMKESDADEVLLHPNIKNVYSAIMGQEVINYKDENEVSTIFGVTSSFIDIDPGEIDQGRFYTDGEDKSLAKVVVLGSNLKQNLFGDSDAVDKRVKIGKQQYKVVGVMKEKGSAGYFNMDDMMYIPLRTIQKLIMGVDYVQFIYAQLDDASLAGVTAEDIRFTMRELHDIDTDDPDKDDFAVTTMDEALAILDTVTGAIQLLLLAIASISLLVGGIGIMNVMYVSVAERTFEIGLRKATGATYNKILNQFLFEAVIITLWGAVFGIVLGTALSYAVSYVANSYGFEWKFFISLSYIVLSAGIAIGVGLISGIYPARTAAKMDPIVALRKE